MKRARSESGLLLLLACLGVGFATSGLGAWTLGNLSESYHPGDILYDDGPKLFQAWLVRRLEQGDLDRDAVGRRLLVMPIASRRATANAMMGADFWDPVIETESERNSLLEIVEDGLVDALRKAPAAGELWLAASKIRTQTSGFDDLAEGYLTASYLTAPREGGLVRSRIVFVNSVDPLLRSDLDDERQRDRTTARTLFPRFEAKLQDWLDSRDKGNSDARRN